MFDVDDRIGHDPFVSADDGSPHMKVVFSTGAVHARDRLDYWHEEATKAYVNHEFATSAGREFRGVIRASSIGELELSSFDCDECTVRHTERCVRRIADDHLIIGHQLSGSMGLHQDGRDAVARVGDSYLIDPRRPFNLEVGPSSRSFVVKVPRRELQARLGDLSALTVRPISHDRPVAALASGFLTMLAGRADALDALASARIVEQALDLVTLTFGTELHEGGLSLSGPRSITLLRLKGAIESRLRDPALRPAHAAAATGISVRYANALLAEEDTSLERFIMHRRLENCRRVLMDPAQASRTVSDIAYSWGFSDVSHFTRRFRAHFGCSPGECRQRGETVS